MKRFAIILSSFICLLSPLNAANYFASPNGGGNGNSYASPTTFLAGVKLLKNGGDTLYLLGGTYAFSDKVSVNKQGTASKNIVISGYPGEKVILDFHKVAYGVRGLTIHADALYVHVKDLAIAYSGKNNLYCEGSYCLFENLDIYGSADTGCQMKRGGNNTIKNVDSHDNFDYETMSNGTANFGGNADGFADKQYTGAGNHYINCRAWNNSDDGWDFFQRVSTSQTIIENCICIENGPPTYNMTNHPRYETDKAWFDSKVGTTMTDRYGQTITITLENYPCQGNGNGFKLGGGYTNHNVLIHHCLAVGNYARGFDQNNNDGTMYVYNCSAYNNNTNYGFTTAYGTNTLRNNISLQSQKSDSYKSKTVAANDHNSWNSGFSVSASDFQSLNQNESTFMHLKAGSKLIDAGVDVNLGFNGSAPDLGCYETDGEHHDPDPDPEPEPQPEGTHSVAFVTIPNATEDQPLLAHLKANELLWVVVTDANDAEVDYSSYEAIVIGSKPSSSAPGFNALKGYNKPIVLLKPWLLKTGVWSWGTAINTQDLSVTVTNSSHPLFRGITIKNGQLELFSQCTTNAVTAISEWTNTTGVETLAAPLSAETASSITELPAGTNCNGTTLPQRMVMIGISEYSMLYLTNDAKHLIENAILYQLGLDIPAEAIENRLSETTNHKYLQDGQLFIQAHGMVFDAFGRRIRQ